MTSLNTIPSQQLKRSKVQRQGCNQEILEDRHREKALICSHISCTDWSEEINLASDMEKQNWNSSLSPRIFKCSSNNIIKVTIHPVTTQTMSHGRLKAQILGLEALPQIPRTELTLLYFAYVILIRIATKCLHRYCHRRMNKLCPQGERPSPTTGISPRWKSLTLKSIHLAQSVY